MRIALSVPLLAISLLAAVEPGRERTFTFEYQAIVKGIPAAAQKLELWIPIPHDDAYQRIANLRVDTPYPYKISVGDQGNTMLRLEIARPKETTVPVTVTFEAARKERIQSTVAAPRGTTLPADLARWLQPDRLVPLDDKIRGWAREVVEAAHAKTDLEMARAIYNHVVSTVKYDKSGKGWGRGDIYYACDERRGNCTDFHAIFIGYARAMGIPARFAILCPRTEARVRLPVITAGRSFTRKESVGCRWMRRKRPRIRPSASTSLALTMKIGWSCRRAATLC